MGILAKVSSPISFSEERVNFTNSIHFVETECKCLSCNVKTINIWHLTKYLFWVLLRPVSKWFLTCEKIGKICQLMSIIR